MCGVKYIVLCTAWSCGKLTTNTAIHCNDSGGSIRHNASATAARLVLNWCWSWQRGKDVRGSAHCSDGTLRVSGELSPLDLSMGMFVSMSLMWSCPCQLSVGKQLDFSAVAGAISNSCRVQRSPQCMLPVLQLQAGSPEAASSLRA